MSEAATATVDVALVETRVREAIADIQVLEVTDLSDGCGDKFHVLVVSSAFEGVKSMKRHQMLYAALKEEMKTIHAVELKPMTPAQYEASKAASE
jgi:stress-induced morphogen